MPQVPYGLGHYRGRCLGPVPGLHGVGLLFEVGFLILLLAVMGRFFHFWAWRKADSPWTTAVEVPGAYPSLDPCLPCHHGSPGNILAKAIRRVATWCPSRYNRHDRHPWGVRPTPYKGASGHVCPNPRQRRSGVP